MILLHLVPTESAAYQNVIKKIMEESSGESSITTTTGVNDEVVCVEFSA